MRKQNVREGSAEASGKAEFASSLQSSFLTHEESEGEVHTHNRRISDDIFGNQPETQKETVLDLIKEQKVSLHLDTTLKIWVFKERTSGGNSSNSLCL